jgi:hypothetical protein
MEDGKMASNDHTTQEDREREAGCAGKWAWRRLMSNAARAALLLCVLWNTLLVFLQGQRIVEGGNCETASLVGLFCTGIVGMLVALAFLATEGERRSLDRLLRSVEELEERQGGTEAQGQGGAQSKR